MTHPWHDELAEYLLDLLPDATRKELEAAAADSPELRAELAAMREALGAFAHLQPRLQPRSGARAALLTALDSSARFSPFVGDLVRHFDLPAARVRELLRQTDDPAHWIRPGPGFSYIEFDTGPRAVASHAGFTKLSRGSHVPYHRHFGPEINYVLDGALRGDDGVLYLPGETMILRPGSAHEFSIPKDADAFFAVVHGSFHFVPKPT